MSRDRVSTLRRAAGLPDRVTDPEVLERIARILAGTDRPVPHA